MSKEFKLTKQENPHRYEELGLHLCFFERRIRGEDKVDYIVMCEEDSQILVSDMLSFPSWESMKEELPTLKSILVAFAHDTKWDASWRDNERVAFIKSVRGNEGLYDVNKTVFYDYKDESPMVEFSQPVKKLKK